MKFYKNNITLAFLSNKIYNLKANAVVDFSKSIIFFNKGKISNLKNAAFIDTISNFKEYRIDDYLIGTNASFNKEKFRRYVKTMCFI